MTEPARYVVLTEADDRHHVAIARQAPATGWVQIVATFARQDRAIDYCELENQFVDDWEDDPIRKEDREKPPVRDEAPSGLRQAIEHFESRSTTTETRTVYTAPSGRLRPSAGLQDEILAELPAMLEEFPKGPTVRVIAQRLAVEEHWVRNAVKELDKQGAAVYMRRRDSQAHHLVALGYKPPEEELTPTQKAVFDVMAGACDEHGMLTMSRTKIADKANVALGNLQCVLDALFRKGRTQEIERGDSVTPSTYRIARREAA